MALSYNPRRRLPLLKTPRNWFDKPELLTKTDSNNTFVNQNWLTKPCGTKSYGYTFREDDYPTLDYNMLHDKTLTVQGLYTEPSQHLTNNNLNYTRQINRTRINQRNNLQLGDFLLPALQPTSAAGPSTSVYRYYTSTYANQTKFYFKQSRIP